MKKIKMAWEWNWPRIVWSWPSFQFINLSIEVGRKGDHTPGIHVMFIVLGVILLEFGYYNIFHDDEPIIAKEHIFQPGDRVLSNDDKPGIVTNIDIDIWVLHDEAKVSAKYNPAQLTLEK